MIIQAARLDVTPGREQEFESTYARARLLIERQPGLISVCVSRCIEEPARYLFLAQWETVADHTVRFPASPEYPEWDALMHPLYAAKPTVEHFDPLDGSSDSGTTDRSTTPR